MEEISKKYRKSMVALAIVVLIIGIVVALIGLKDVISFDPVQNVDKIGVHAVEEGRATVWVYDVYDYFCSYGKNDDPRDYFVIVDSGDDYGIMCVQLSGKKNKVAYDNMNIIFEAAGDEDFDIDKLPLKKFSVTGEVKRLSGDEKKYYYEYLETYSDEYTMEELEYLFVPYMIVEPEIKYGFVIVGIISVIASVLIMVSAFTSDALKNIKDYCKQFGSPESKMAEIERLYENAPARYNTKSNDEILMLVGDLKPSVVSKTDVVWIYKYIVTQKQNFIPVSKTYYIRFKTADGRTFQVNVSKKECDAAIEYFAQIIPDAIFGYSKELENMYNKDRSQMVSIVANRRLQRTGGYDSFSAESNDYGN